ncbi:hypothetical protein NEUTE2DRAFT_116685, partial [Neurospora tetrasperma FGSC 2509]
MPNLDISDLDKVIGVLSAFFILFGTISNQSRSGNRFTLGLNRIVIGVQVAITGYQFLAKYQLHRSKEMALCWLPIETIMWLFATLCMLATAIANGPFAGNVRGSQTAPLFLAGICGMLGTDDLLACFVAGNTLNWKSEFLHEAEVRHDEVNSCMNALLNFGSFMCNGLIMPWSKSRTTGTAWGRLISLGFLVLLFRRIPTILGMYKLMPNVCKNLREGLVYGILWSYRFRPCFICGVKPIMNDAVVVRRKSVRVPTPVNAEVNDNKTFVAYNRFSKPSCEPSEMPIVEERYIGDMYYDGGRAAGRRRLIRSSLRWKGLGVRWAI